MSVSPVSKTSDGLPEFLGPVTIKEIRQGLRANRFVIPFVALQIFALLAVAAEFVVTTIGDGSGGGGNVDANNLLAWVVYGAFAVVLPLTMMASLQHELASGRNVELLLLSNLDRWQIIRGKWLVSCLLSGLMLLSIIPYMLTRFFIGGVSFPETLMTIYALILLNATVSALAIGASGFQNYIGRIALFGVATGACAIVAAVLIGTSRVYDSPIDGFWKVAAALAYPLAGACLYTLYGLQLGRARLRLFENPYDPPASGLIIALIIFSPIIIGMMAGVSVDYFFVTDRSKHRDCRSSPRAPPRGRSAARSAHRPPRCSY
ncbi:MAG: hypothetical protein AAGJ83_10705, partial [Planctomycetota bacterium]